MDTELHNNHPVAHAVLDAPDVHLLSTASLPTAAIAIIGGQMSPLPSHRRSKVLT
jgi:hypothetical protein